VDIDNQEGGRLAARYLLGKGYRRPAVIGETGEPDYALHPAIGRLQGFREVCEAAGLELPDERIRLNPYAAETVAAEVDRLLELPVRPDAIFATSDLQAVAVLKTARKCGLSVPGDLAVLGFDNTDLADYLDLSTVDQSLDASGRIALELVLRHMEDATRPVQHVRLRMEVSERSSA
jgi:LacI family transcriptional regulator